jgi:hypothetical protein
MKRPKIMKFGSSAEFITMPTPSSSKVPNWYKKIPKQTDGTSHPRIFVPGKEGVYPTRTVKHCAPFLDSLTSGYMGELWQDIQVTRTMSGTEISWATTPEVCQSRDPDNSDNFPVPAGCSPTQYVWLSPYIFKTPPGYSLLITHPFNRFDLPFFTLTGIIDADYVAPSGNLPFYLNEDFEGTIEAGTPIFQAIPFKRENWQSEFDPSLEEQSRRSRWMSFRTAKGYYRENHWVKKKYT